MNRRTFLVLVIVAGIVTLLWFFRRCQKAEVTVARAITLQANSPGSSKSNPEFNGIPGTDEQKRSRVSKIDEIMEQANQPIDFYGKVIDQDNIPVPGVMVRLSVKSTRLFAPGATRDVFDYIERQTDAEGLFGLTDRKGALLSIESMEKSGYKAPYLTDKAFWYWAPVPGSLHKPDVNAPVVFRMWKSSKAERLLRKGIGTGIPYDGTPVYFDLQNGKEVAAGGDVRVTLTRTPLQIQRGQKNYEWIATIEAVDGGVVVSSDEFMYLAPELGYEPKIVISMPAAAEKWSAERTISFYLKSRGKYARVIADFTTNYDKPKTGFSIEAYTNPSGSRNLEFDSLQDVVKESRLNPQTNKATSKP